MPCSSIAHLQPPGIAPPDMTVLAEIDLSKERMKFSAGHFTIFSATHRENLHGHNYTVGVVFKAAVGPDGMVCDYKLLKDVATAACDSLDECFLLPLHSPHLAVEQRADLVIAKFAHETLQFLPRDVKLLAVRNITVEELSAWMVQEIRKGLVGALAGAVREIAVRVASGPGQGATTRWQAT